MDSQDIRRLFNGKNRFAAHAGIEAPKASSGAAVRRMGEGRRTWLLLEAA
ncbi:hypothetical protein BerOc1_00671 [Pseudodesulfovibrio hydrargyri]|uniref:Uncharacterized protein n=1 Tax=Pseudodesulfovibrio hydrargyri TaxID=2125990 RepID=A0A1J5N070_9BACT|nr:hypothetical protein [Pseudodesulfovibrio hydrargyri]OIQ52197.1 hypothetical protein BerOc1_00671 [Pseudodesulfovibrio hydrargyri]